MKKFSMYIFSGNKGILASFHCIFVIEIFASKEREKYKEPILYILFGTIFKECTIYFLTE